MRLPDFLVVGAQKSGTTSLFAMLSKHPQLYLPSRKEVQFFSSPMLYPKGLSWYSEEFFAGCPADKLAGEVSPQYMYSTQIAQRVHEGVPEARIIAILRDPLDRAWSHYLMTQRREQENRPPEEAFAAALATDESDSDAPETGRYFQFGDYERVLGAYLKLYGRERICILFQEDLDQRPKHVYRDICAFLGIDEIIPDNVNTRVHQSGDVRSKALSQLTKSDNPMRRVLRAFVPRRLRPTIMFWAEMLNIRPAKDKTEMPESLRREFNGFAERQAAFLERGVWSDSALACCHRREPEARMRALPDNIRASAPFTAFVEDIAALGVAPVANGGLAYAVIAARSNPRWWLLPLANRKAAAAGLEMLQPVSKAATVAKTVARGIARFGPASRLGRGQIRFSGLPDFGEAFGGEAEHVAYFTGTDGPHRKTAVQIMDANGAILGYAKLTRASHVRPYLSNEAAMLRHVAGLGLRSVDVPRVLEAREESTHSVLVTDSVKSAAHAAPLQLGAAHHSFLEELSAKTERMGAGAVLDWLASRAVALAQRAGPDWIARFAKIDVVLRPHEAAIATCLTHGDFTPWNTFLQGSRLYVFDWEYAQKAWPKGFDQTHFILSTTPQAEQADRAPDLIRALSETQFAGDKQAARRALLASLACHAALYLGRLEEADSPLAAWAEGPARAALIDRCLAEAKA